MGESNYLTISRVCSQFPGRKGTGTISPSTVQRWILKGVPKRGSGGVQGRVRLGAIRVGHRWLVSPAALREFSEELTAEPPAATVPPPAGRHHTKEVAAATARLASMLARGRERATRANPNPRDGDAP